MKPIFKKRYNAPAFIAVALLAVSLVLTGVVIAADNGLLQLDEPAPNAAVLEARELPVEIVELKTDVPAEPEVIEPADPKPEDLQLIDYFTATAYCTTGTTATGTYTTVGRTLAVNPKMIPYGTHVWLFLEDGTLVGDFYAEDTGSNMMAHPYVVDIYMGEDSYDECIEWGARRVNIYTDPSEET
ncbi:MAG: 3D domain-containing protein [Oscillospiraceae bacterium]|nr:3D domain-containing protein [Oscillospiraceae bacterium]